MLFVQLDFVTTRSRLLQRALSRLYAALAFFVGTSVSIGLVAITSSAFTLVPIVLGLTGAGLLLYAAFLLIDRLYQYYRFGSFFNTYVTVFAQQARELNPSRVFCFQ